MVEYRRKLTSAIVGSSETLSSEKDYGALFQPSRMQHGVSEMKKDIRYLRLLGVSSIPVKSHLTVSRL